MINHNRKKIWLLIHIFFTLFILFFSYQSFPKTANLLFQTCTFFFTKLHTKKDFSTRNFFYFCIYRLSLRMKFLYLSLTHLAAKLSKCAIFSFFSSISFFFAKLIHYFLSPPQPCISRMLEKNLGIFSPKI